MSRQLGSLFSFFFCTKSGRFIPWGVPEANRADYELFSVFAERIKLRRKFVNCRVGGFIFGLEFSMEPDSYCYNSRFRVGRLRCSLFSSGLLWFFRIFNLRKINFKDPTSIIVEFDQTRTKIQVKEDKGLKKSNIFEKNKVNQKISLMNLFRKFPKKKQKKNWFKNTWLALKSQ